MCMQCHRRIEAHLEGVPLRWVEHQISLHLAAHLAHELVPLGHDLVLRRAHVPSARRAR